MRAVRRPLRGARVPGRRALFAEPVATPAVDNTRGTRCRCLPGHGPGPAPPRRPDHRRRRRWWHHPARGRRARPRRASGTASSRSTTTAASPIARRASRTCTTSCSTSPSRSSSSSRASSSGRSSATAGSRPTPSCRPRPTATTWSRSSGRSSRRSSSLVLFAFSWQTLNTVDAKVTPTSTSGAVAARFQWPFDYLDGARGRTHKSCSPQSLPVGEDGGMVAPGRRARDIDLRSQDVIHAFYVPKFLFKRDVVPGKTNTFELHRRGAGHLPRPVRRAVRRLPRVDAVRRPRDPRGRIRRLARGADRRGERRRRRPPRRAGPPGPPARARRAARPSALDQRRALDRLPRRRRSRSISTTRTRASRTTSRSRTQAAASKFKGDIFTGVAARSTTRSRRSPPARTPSSARSTRT